MKRMLVMLLLAALLFGCVPTPEHEIVENKGDKKDWQTAAQPISDTVGVPAEASVETKDYEQQESPLYERLGAPKFWSTENNDYGFPIKAVDCPVYLPDVQAAPILEAAPRSLTQADFDAVRSILFPIDGVKWMPTGIRTKEDCASLILGVQEELDKCEPGSSEYEYQKKRLEEYTETYSAIYEIALFASEVEPLEPVLGTYPCGVYYSKDKGASQGYIHGFSGQASVAGEKWELRAYVDEEIYGNSIYAKRDSTLWSNEEQPLDTPYGVKMTRAEALKKASEIAEVLTGGELAPCYLVPICCETGDSFDFSKRWSQWRVVLMRTCMGVGTAFALEDVGGAMDSSVTAPVAYEKITVDFDDQGVTAITWTTPMNVTGIVSSDAELLSFEEAAGKAMKHIAAFWKPTVEAERERGVENTIYIHRVTFGLWRIAKKNGGYYYVPVYHFFADPNEGRWCTTEGYWDQPGTPRQRFSNTIERIKNGTLALEPNFFPLNGDCLTFGGEYWGGITVNALDGTIINKDLGY